MGEIEEIIQFLIEKKESALYLSKSYVDKSKRSKFRDYEGAYVDALILVEEIKIRNIKQLNKYKNGSTRKN